MMQTQVIAAYEQLLEQARSLLECAKRSDWDAIFTLKSQGLIDAAYLRRAEGEIKLDAVAQQRKLELVTQILELDIQLSGFLRARQDDLDQLMRVNRCKSDLNHAYRAPSANSNSVISMGLHLYQKK